MMKMKGFTLTEVLIVVVIISILAALVIPRFFGQPERGQVAEAVANLSALRQAEAAYFLEHDVYTATKADLDIDVPADGASAFNYAVNAAGTSTATRSNAVSVNASFRGRTIILLIDGTWAGNHPFVPAN